MSGRSRQVEVGGDGHEVTVPPMRRGGGLHRTMEALKLQQFQHNLQKIFLQRFRRMVFRVLFGPSDGPPQMGAGGLQGGGGDETRGHHQRSGSPAAVHKSRRHAATIRPPPRPHTRKQLPISTVAGPRGGRGRGAPSKASMSDPSGAAPLPPGAPLRGGACHCLRPTASMLQFTNAAHEARPASDTGGRVNRTTLGPRPITWTKGAVGGHTRWRRSDAVLGHQRPPREWGRSSAGAARRCFVRQFIPQEWSALPGGGAGPPVRLPDTPPSPG